MENQNPTHNEHRDDQASKLGMWLFLFTEILLFGGLFFVYAIYRYMNHDDFMHASKHLNLTFGLVNTIVLITSSFTVAVSITAIQKNNPKLALRLLVLTILFALTFMVNKFFEWGHKIELGIYPGSEYFLSLPKGEALFYVLYYFMTGLHGLHVIIGAILIGVTIYRLKKNRITHDNYIFQENAGLYWHLVDLIWIFLFPLLYLIT